MTAVSAGDVADVKPPWSRARRVAFDREVAVVSVAARETHDREAFTQTRKLVG